MVSNKIMRLWGAMVRQLPIRMIVPQHGCPLTGRAVAEFIDWAEELQCGVDLMGPDNYKLPA
jgi:flavorubredoxin